MADKINVFQVPAHLLVNPLLAINMGAEMIYILRQRLNAQQISTEKSSRVLCDIVATMFDMDRIDNLFKARKAMDSGGLRQFFQEIAHSSIMRLNYQSMDKLFDLMLMGFKMQMICCKDAFEMVECTLNHVDTLLHILSNIENTNTNAFGCTDLLNRTRHFIVKIYTGMPMGKVMTIRRAALHFLKDRRIKISLLLKSKQQSVDGFILNNTAGFLPKNVDTPGNGLILDTANQTKQSIDPPLNLLNTVGVYKLDPSSANQNQNWSDGNIHSQLGLDMYDTENKQNTAPCGQRQLSEQMSTTAIAKKTNAKAATNELSTLANLIVSDNKNESKIKFDLFDDCDIDLNFISAEDEKQTKIGTKPNMLRFKSAEKGSNVLEAALAGLEMEPDTNNTNTNDDDDLLDLI